jgi:hypothetical protein
MFGFVERFVVAKIQGGIGQLDYTSPGQTNQQRSEPDKVTLLRMQYSC